MVETLNGDTWVGQKALLLGGGNLEACLVHIYPSGPDMGRRYPLRPGRTLVGRGESAAVRVQDNSASRVHAVVESTPDGCYVIDQKSVNGTHVNDTPTAGAHRLADGDYLRIGNAIFRYLEGGNIEAEYHEEIYRLTVLDGLTGLHNRRFLTEYLDRELSRAERHARPLALAMFDIDRFKGINDGFGHLAGDMVLRELSALLRPVVRKDELLARYGGEEFAMALPETTTEQAVAACERLRRTVAEHTFEYDGKTIPVTVSIGVATNGQEADTPERLIRAADTKLYKAKGAGRNRVAH